MQLPHIICSPCMKNVCPLTAVKYLCKVEDIMPSVVLMLTKAFMALKMGDLTMYEREMNSHKEVRYTRSMNYPLFVNPRSMGCLVVVFYSKITFQLLLFLLIFCVGST